MSYNRKTEYCEDCCEKEEVEIYSYGLLEDLTMCNCYSVEQVYDEMWEE